MDCFHSQAIEKEGSRSHQQSAPAPSQYSLVPRGFTFMFFPQRGPGHLDPLLSMSSSWFVLCLKFSSPQFRSLGSDRISSPQEEFGALILN